MLLFFYLRAKNRVFIAGSARLPLLKETVYEREDPLSFMSIQEIEGIVAL